MLRIMKIIMTMMMMMMMMMISRTTAMIISFTSSRPSWAFTIALPNSSCRVSIQNRIGMKSSPGYSWKNFRCHQQHQCLRRRHRYVFAGVQIMVGSCYSSRLMRRYFEGATVLLLSPCRLVVISMMTVVFAGSINTKHFVYPHCYYPCRAHIGVTTTEDTSCAHVQLRSCEKGRFRYKLITGRKVCR